MTASNPLEDDRENFHISVEEYFQQLHAIVDALPSPSFSNKSFFSMSEESLGILYADAYANYKQKRYNDAKMLFRLLTVLDPFKCKHWKGLAAAFFMMNKSEEAFNAYQTAVLLQPEDPALHLHAAECLLSMNNYKKARQALLSAQSLIQANSIDNTNTALKRRIIYLLELCDKNMKIT